LKSTRDHLWEVCYHFRKLDGAEAALRTAVRDMQERGPAIQFRIPLSDGHSVDGVAERYWVRVSSQADFPEDFRLRFTAFLGSLTLQPIQIHDGEVI